MGTLQTIISGAVNALGLELRRKTLPAELDAYERQLLEYVQKKRLSMVPTEGLVNTIKTSRYVAENGISGDFVECGVWRGGNAILAKKMFEYLGVDKKVWLFDTFAGMTEPTDRDATIHSGHRAFQRYAKDARESHNDWCFAPIKEVRKNLLEADIEMREVVFVEGDVTETLLEKKNVPESISVLRLDTDWYESTLVELQILYPILSKGGVLIVDDYGFWSGSKLAVDDYFSATSYKPFLNVVHPKSVRSAVKI